MKIERRDRSKLATYSPFCLLLYPRMTCSCAIQLSVTHVTKDCDTVTNNRAPGGRASDLEESHALIAVAIS